MSLELQLPLVPPSRLVTPGFCQYANGPCQQVFSAPENPTLFFAYASKPEPIASTIRKARELLEADQPTYRFKTWEQMNVVGKQIFTGICTEMRQSVALVADVTTLNFNLMFEIGFAIGLEVPILPIRDVSYERDKRLFEELGMLDTIGYIDFSNASELADRIRGALPGSQFKLADTPPFNDSPLYLLKGHIETEGAVQLLSVLKKSPLKFRSFDPAERSRLSLYEATRQVVGSYGVIGHLLSPNRRGSQVQNAITALICGMAMALQKPMAMLQEERVLSPIDYRDVMTSYDDPSAISRILEPLIRKSTENLQASYGRRRVRKSVLLELDMGDMAAENEVQRLDDYYVTTGQYVQAKQGNARLVIGRKGSGKTAIFYQIRDAYANSTSHLVLDLKPEGPQFTRLREVVLDKMSTGLQEHTMVAFWTFVLLSELARKIRDEHSRIQYDPPTLKLWQKVDAAYEAMKLGDGDSDFGQRLLLEVEKVIAELGDRDLSGVDGRITEGIFATDVARLRAPVTQYLTTKSEVIILVDNLDKGWPVRGATDVDLLIVRSLLEATRTIQHQFSQRSLNLRCLVFLRSDIFESLKASISDKGKDTAIELDYDDPELFKEIIRARIEASSDLGGTFDNVWRSIFPPSVGATDSFQYIVDRTLMRPRDMIGFVKKSVECAINRGHVRVEEEDILEGERLYSEDLLLDLQFEISDTFREHGDVVYNFHGGQGELSAELVEVLLDGVEGLSTEAVRDMLVWFGFLGVKGPTYNEPIYTHSARYSAPRVAALIRAGCTYVVHPAFRAALDITT